MEKTKHPPSYCQQSSIGHIATLFSEPENVPPKVVFKLQQWFCWRQFFLCWKLGRHTFVQTAKTKAVKVGTMEVE